MRLWARCVVVLVLLLSALATNPVGSLEQRVHEAPVPGSVSVPSHHAARALTLHADPDTDCERSEAAVDISSVPGLTKTLAHGTTATHATLHALAAATTIHHSALANPPPLID
jgi:hypothetical protein